MQDSFSRLRAFGLIALHIGLIALSLLLAFAGFTFWPRLEGLSDWIVLLLGGLGVLTAFLNGHAAWQQFTAARRHAKAPSPDYVALTLAIVMLLVATRIFQPTNFAA